MEIELKIRSAGMIVNHEKFQKIFHRFPWSRRAFQKPGKSARAKSAEKIHPEGNRRKSMSRIDIEIASRRGQPLKQSMAIDRIAAVVRDNRESRTPLPDD